MEQTCQTVLSVHSSVRSNCLTYEGKHAFYNSYVLPCLDYCVTTWGYSSKTNLDKLYRYQKRIGRVILNDSECNSDVIFARLGWLSIYERIDFLTAKLVYKCLFDEAPESLKCLFSIRENRSLRNAGIELSLPFPKHEFRKNCFEYAGAKIWNSLPTAVRTANNVNDCKKSYNFITSNPAWLVIEILIVIIYYLSHEHAFMPFISDMY